MSGELAVGNVGHHYYYYCVFSVFSLMSRIWFQSSHKHKICSSCWLCSLAARKVQGLFLTRHIRWSVNIFTPTSARICAPLYSLYVFAVDRDATCVEQQHLGWHSDRREMDPLFYLNEFRLKNMKICVLFFKLSNSLCLRRFYFINYTKLCIFFLRLIICWRVVECRLSSVEPSTTSNHFYGRLWSTIRFTYPLLPMTIQLNHQSS